VLKLYYWNSHLDFWLHLLHFRYLSKAIDFVPVAGKNFKMRVLSLLLLLAPVFGAPADLDERDVVVPAACQQPLPVSLAYNVLAGLQATSFCSSFLHFSTVTVTGKCNYPASDDLLTHLKSYCIRFNRYKHTNTIRGDLSNSGYGDNNSDQLYSNAHACC